MSLKKVLIDFSNEEMSELDAQRASDNLISYFELLKEIHNDLELHSQSNSAKSQSINNNNFIET